jgi:hypothetical protein
MEDLIEEFKLATITFSDNTLCITGPSDISGFITFVCAYRSHTWNEVPKTSKVIFKNMMVEKSDSDFGGDIWCMKWLIDYFGDNFSCENCYYAHFDATKTGGRYVITTEISLKDFV